jgi:hypothetical protein
MTYRTNTGPERGPILWHALAFAIGVIEDPPPPGKSAGFPSGIAFPEEADAQGHQLWMLVVRGERLPGRFVCVDRCFIPAEVEG